MVSTFLGYVETTAILRRHLNRGTLGPVEFAQARSFLERDVVLGGEFELLPIGDADLLSSISLIDRHNLNASDAAILTVFQQYEASQAPGAAPCVLVSSDRRLLRAAAPMLTLNPEL